MLCTTAPSAVSVQQVPHTVHHVTCRLSFYCLLCQIRLISSSSKEQDGNKSIYFPLEANTRHVFQTDHIVLPKPNEIHAFPHHLKRHSITVFILDSGCFMVVKSPAVNTSSSYLVFCILTDFIISKQSFPHTFTSAHWYALIHVTYCSVQQSDKNTH